VLVLEDVAELRSVLKSSSSEEGDLVAALERLEKVAHSALLPLVLSLVLL
jgi:hypothetical protein